MGQSALNKAVKPTLIGLILLSFALSAWLISEGMQLERTYQQQTHARASDYSDRANVAVKRTCQPLPATEEIRCIREENQAARKGAYDENSLKAQLVSSVWTRQMGIAGVIAMAFGVLGIGLVFVTFAETRRATDANHPPKIRVNRAAIWRKGDRDKAFQDGRHQRICGEIWAYNAGMSEAVISRAEMTVYRGSGPLPMTSPLRDGAKSYFPVASLAYGAADKWDFEFDAGGSFENLYLIGEVVYSGPWGNGTGRHTLFARKYCVEERRFIPVVNVDYEESA